MSSLRQSVDLHFRVPVRVGASVERKAQLAAVVGSKSGKVMLSLSEPIVGVGSVSAEVDAVVSSDGRAENIESSLEEKAMSSST